MELPLRKKIKRRFSLRRQLEKHHLPVNSVILICYLIVTLVICTGIIPEQRSWFVGTVATRDVQADRSITYEDIQATKSRQNTALAEFENIYTLELERFNNFTLTEIDAVFTGINALNEEGEAEPTLEEKMAAVKDLNLNVSDGLWQAILLKDPQELERLHSQIVLLSSDVMAEGVKENHVNEAKQQIADSITHSSALNNDDKSFAIALLNKVHYYPTLRYDPVATREKKESILAEVEPVQHTIQRGQTIVNKGDVVTENQYEALKALGYTADSPVIFFVLGAASLMAIFFGCFYLGAKYFSTYKDVSWRKILDILLVIFTITVLILPLVFAIDIGSNRTLAAQVGFLVPVSASAMLIAVLLSSTEAIFLLPFLAALPAIYAENISFFVVGILAGIVAISQTKRLNRRKDLFWVAMSISGMNMAAITAWHLAVGSEIPVIGLALLYGFINGFISVIFTVGILPYLESAFRITTSISLLELADPNKPLLKRLLQEAPGTYYHSLMVANLAEAIAHRIDADGLLLRTAAYYHDIGKLKRPAFFTENQIAGKNPHDKISPMLSNLIITSHVKDGVALAKEAELPQPIIDLIAQHHGDTVVRYFYMKAKEQDQGVNENDFRYHQKKPQTREAAILMIADTVEAAVRSKKEQNAGQIEGFIHQLILNKQKDGQFEECDLTFRDLNIIAEVCTRVTCGMYHKRIEYPEKAELRN